MGIFGRDRFGECCPPKRADGLSDVRDLVGLGESKAWECSKIPQMVYSCDSVSEGDSGSHRMVTQNLHVDAHSFPFSNIGDISADLFRTGRSMMERACQPSTPWPSDQV